MRLTITNYLDAISSWCFWATPAWRELKERFGDRAEFRWKIALMDESGMPRSRAQMKWFYQRSGMVMRSPRMLNADWFEVGRKEFLPPNCVAEAARALGIDDDRVWMAMLQAALHDGKKIGDWEVASEVGRAASGLEKTELLELARSPEIEARVREMTAEFHALGVTQRPTFVIDTPIGDRAVFSGFAKTAPLAAAIDSMLEDIAAYESFAAHFGEPPA
ncbi:MAG TPA: DsbA family protein [Chthoniobacterales bacterium]|jgi:predicted DsbA family dithiol-disulfide isomerase